jgi:ketosteroid isomerase-like protein
MNRGACVALVLCLAAGPVVGAETAAQQAIRAADEEWARVFAARDLDRSVSVCTSDAAVLAPNAPRASGHQAIRELFQETFALPELKISWTPSEIRVANSADLGYSTGAYKMTFKDPKGATVSDVGKYSTVWQKQHDGKWKVVLDSYSSDLPASSPAP